jgi:hypothetical protein
MQPVSWRIETWNPAVQRWQRVADYTDVAMAKAECVRYIREDKGRRYRMRPA